MKKILRKMFRAAISMCRVRSWTMRWRILAPKTRRTITTVSAAIITTARKKASGNRIAALAACLLLAAPLLAQDPDSTDFYKRIRDFAHKRRFTRLIHAAVFVDPKPGEYPEKPAVKKQSKPRNPYLKYSDKVIRKITIRVYDPFGYSVNDTTRHKTEWHEKLGNRLHKSTRQWVIGNKLLFEENDRLNALEITESERLLRQAGFVNDARIIVSRVGRSDSVDVLVLVQDKWSITGAAGASPTSADGNLRDMNFLGLGQQFEQYVAYRAPNRYDFNGSYSIANIDNTYISSRLAYYTNKQGTLTGLSFERPFYSPLAEWAGGVSLAYGQQFFDYKDPVESADLRTNVTKYQYDLWAGKTVRLNGGKTLFEQSNNFMLGARYYTTRYLKRETSNFDLRGPFPETWTLIGNAGFAVQQFYKDRYIYRFGANEDVPHGLLMQFLYGIEKWELARPRYYLGMEVAQGRKLSVGYVAATFSYGVFFNRKIANDVSTNYRINYFTDLFSMGRWYLRQFFNFNLLYGENKEPREKITLTSADLYGFNGDGLRGNTKMILQSETVAYAPYDLVGFRFAPVLMAGLGMLGDGHPVLQADLYQGYSVGLMVRNENLLNSTFQVSFGLYPVQPDGQHFVMKYNPVTSFTLRVRGFGFNKPMFFSY
jgi:hypothetical protein